MPARLARALLLLSVPGLLIFASGWTTANADQPETIDDDYLALESQIPGFGGMYAEGNTLTVFLTDPEQRSAAERAIAARRGPEGLPAGGIQVRQGQYSFSQLKGWQEQANALFELPGVVFTDVDESQNRVTVGVEQKSHAGAVMQSLMRMGIPLKAVEIVETGPVYQMAGTVRDEVRPLLGGAQLNFPGFLCTYGFNATRSGVSGFVTSSHCTSKQGGVESTQYWQPTQAAISTSIGTEIIDPAYSKANCPRSIKGKVCRSSDSAFVRIDANTPFSLGKIARTTGMNDGSLAISGDFTISGKGAALANEAVSKVGRTTGWSQGRVIRICADTGISGSNIVQVCQTWVSAPVMSGDSGAPVFKGTSNVTLVGILWGGTSDNKTFIYSPIGQVEQELGALTVN